MPWCRLALSGGFASGFQLCWSCRSHSSTGTHCPRALCLHPQPSTSPLPFSHSPAAFYSQSPPSALSQPIAGSAHPRLAPDTPAAPLLPSSCDEASSSQGRMGRRGWAPSSQPRVWQQGRGTWRTPLHLQATGLHARHSWVPQTRFVATAGSLMLKPDTKSAGGYSQHGKLEVTQLELVRAPRCRDRHTRIAKKKTKNLLGSQVDLPAMPMISRNLLPLHFFLVFSSSPPFKLACGFMDYPEALPPHFPSTSQLEPLQCFPSQSFPFPAASKQTGFCLSLPIHSVLLG